MPSQPQHPAGLLLGSLEASGSKTALVDRCAREGSAFQERQRSYCIEKMKTITKHSLFCTVDSEAQRPDVGSDQDGRMDLLGIFF